MYTPLDWKAYLKPEEIARLAEMDARQAAFSKERRQIRQRARARAVKADLEARGLEKVVTIRKKENANGGS